MTTCKELADFLWKYIDGELPESQRAEFDRHLQMCIGCRDYLATYKKTMELCCGCKPCEKTPPPPMPEMLVKAILNSIKAGQCDNAPAAKPHRGCGEQD